MQLAQLMLYYHDANTHAGQVYGGLLPPLVVFFNLGYSLFSW